MTERVIPKTLSDHQNRGLANSQQMSSLHITVDFYLVVNILYEQMPDNSTLTNKAAKLVIWQPKYLP